MTRLSMYEFAGGDAAFVALASAHHRRCLADPELNHPFSHGVKTDHVERLAWYWAEVFGGPARYSESYGGQPAMLSVHAGNGTGEDFDRRFVACFIQAADDVGLPGDAEFRAGLRAYMEWAVAEVVSYAPPGSEVPSSAPVPRWSWNGLVQAPG
jgi:hemoglobin